MKTFTDWAGEKVKVKTEYDPLVKRYFALIDPHEADQWHVAGGGWTEKEAINTAKYNWNQYDSTRHD